MKHRYREKSILQELQNIVISIYLAILLGIFPLYYKYQYEGMGDAKYKLFLNATVLFVLVFFLLYTIEQFRYLKHKKIPKRRINDIAIEHDKNRMDMAIVLYLLCGGLSYLCSQFKEMAFWGADGWNMGLFMQILVIAVYFILARRWSYQNWPVVLLGISSAMVFIIGIFHRFDVEILPIYGNLSVDYKILFLSTIGQASWYSSFLCTVYPVFLYLFFISENKKVRWAAGIYSAIAMCSLVTQNSDSAFLSLAVVLLLLFYLSFDEQKLQERWLEVLLLVNASFCFMGICQSWFAFRMIPLDTMSLFMSQSRVVWGLLICELFFYWVVKYKNKGSTLKKLDIFGKKWNKAVFWAVFAAVVALVVGTVLLIIGNSTGFLWEHFQWQSTNNYLLFNDAWGNHRGFSWKLTVTTFMEMPLLQKLFGVGPDCFSAYIASVPEYFEKCSQYWGGLTLTNAHNEYLTKLYDLGVVGTAAYLGMLGSSVWILLKNRRKDPLFPAAALCVVSYMAHNVFCYEQVCCTPFLFLLLGIIRSTHNPYLDGSY